VNGWEREGRTVPEPGGRILPVYAEKPEKGTEERIIHTPD